jgi:hypothetical protein
MLCPGRDKLLVQHHVKYKELDGIDEVVMMNKADHIALHRRLRKEKKCKLPPKKLHEISSAAYRRTPRGRAVKKRMYKKSRQIIEFYETVDSHISFVETIIYNSNTGNVRYRYRFRGRPRRDILFIDIPSTRQ